MPKRKIPENLPESKNKEFWGDSEKYSGIIEIIRANKKHVWEQDGPNMARCTSCPLRHGQYLKLGTEVRNGRIVAKRPIQF